MSEMTGAGKVTRVSVEEVRHVADLANLELTDEELPRMAHDLDAMLGLVTQLNELDTTEIAAMAQVSEALGRVVAPAGEALRRDIPKPSVSQTWGRCPSSRLPVAFGPPIFVATQPGSRALESTPGQRRATAKASRTLCSLVSE